MIKVMKPVHVVVLERSEKADTSQFSTTQVKVKLKAGCGFSTLLPLLHDQHPPDSSHVLESKDTLCSLYVFVSRLPSLVR